MIKCDQKKQILCKILGKMLFSGIFVITMNFGEG